LVTTAEEMKERAMKRIMRFQSSHTAQEIFAYVLGELHARFVLHVSPLVATGAARAEIDAAMEARVVTPVAESLEPSPLNLSPALVLAFLFFLAGNCHVKWD
jgi:hypothetical protein